MIDFRLTIACLVLSAGSVAAECTLPDFQLAPSDPKTATFELALDYPTVEPGLDRFST